MRVLEEEGFVDVLREQPPPRLKQLYAEKHCKVPLCYAVPTVPLLGAYYTYYSTCLYATWHVLCLPCLPC